MHIKAILLHFFTDEFLSGILQDSDFNESNVEMDVDSETAMMQQSFTCLEITDDGSSVSY